jgi:hypothetical protein
MAAKQFHAWYNGPSDTGTAYVSQNVCASTRQAICLVGTTELDGYCHAIQLNGGNILAISLVAAGTGSLAKLSFVRNRVTPARSVHSTTGSHNIPPPQTTA